MKKTQTQAQAPEPVPFTQDQRSKMTELITDAKDEAKHNPGCHDEYNCDCESDLNYRIETELARKLAKENGALRLVEKIRKLKRDIADAEKELGSQGFYWDSVRVSISHKCTEENSQSFGSCR